MPQVCPYCLTGIVELRKVIFVQPHSANLIVVDRIPALVCNTCGEKSYEPRALENLHRLLWAANNDKPLSGAARIKRA